MREQLEQRLEQLEVERAKGKEALASLDQQRAQLRETLWSIRGAIQVLSEELAPKAEPVDTPDE